MVMSCSQRDIYTQKKSYIKVHFETPLYVSMKGGRGLMMRLVVVTTMKIQTNPFSSP
jgi:hypothetical protein